MVFYIIGLGLDIDSMSGESEKIIKTCDKVYLETYTVDFPYNISDLKKKIKKEIILADRKKVESEEVVLDAKKKNIALLVYGSPLFATTHYSLILRCKKEKVSYKTIFNASVFDAVSETGLQLYKFGKIASVPAWKPHKNYMPDSFADIIKENQTINAHTLLLVDIGVDYKDALRQLKEVFGRHKINVEKILVCCCLGTKKQKIKYENFENLLEENISRPFCFIIPSEELHFLEKKALNLL